MLTTHVKNCVSNKKMCSLSIWMSFHVTFSPTLLPIFIVSFYCMHEMWYTVHRRSTFHSGHRNRKCFTICHIVLIWSIDTNLNRNQCFLFNPIRFIYLFFSHTSLMFGIFLWWVIVQASHCFPFDLILTIKIECINHQIVAY